MKVGKHFVDDGIISDLKAKMKFRKTFTRAFVFWEAHKMGIPFRVCKKLGNSLPSKMCREGLLKRDTRTPYWEVV